MVQLKSSFVLISAVLALGAMSAVDAASVDFEINTDEDPVTKRPQHAHIACVIKSTSCMSTAHYLDRDYGGKLKLTTCHHDNMLKNYWNRITAGDGNGMFVNTFYVTACPEDGAGKPDCDSKSVTASSVRDMIDDVVNRNTKCNAYIDCNRVDDVDDQCFPKK
ncbi:uncharacterized protein SRS1_12084 [Sporisorium reilianum f. sp. reilianum]|uniref:Secreted protein n=1 Tax=Sporisorium reilianum f. sp. reilianum TaxID=72559 RepID=A0A2N8U855_9BASI|nr:uncharacterized protein SRS1_12084 [Sporisorium reilianum f. sp. reilianum]